MRTAVRAYFSAVEAPQTAACRCVKPTGDRSGGLIEAGLRAADEFRQIGPSYHLLMLTGFDHRNVTGQQNNVSGSAGPAAYRITRPTSPVAAWPGAGRLPGGPTPVTLLKSDAPATEVYL